MIKRDDWSAKIDIFSKRKEEARDVHNSREIEVDVLSVFRPQ